MVSGPMVMSKRKTVDALADEIAAAAAHVDAGLHGLLVSIREFDELSGWALQGASSCAHWLSWRVGMSLGAAREYVRVARSLAQLPRIDEAMRRGELSYTKVRAMVRVATAENEELLMHQARGSTGAQLERICAAYHRLPDNVRATDEDRRYVRKRTHRDGTMTLELRLMPDEVDELWLALKETRSRLSPEMEERPTLADAALHWARSEANGPNDSAESSESNDFEEDGQGSDSAESPEAIPSPQKATSTCATEAASRVTPGRAVQPLLFVHLRPEHIAGPYENHGETSEPPVAPVVASPEPWRAELHDGTPISGHALKRIACDCGLVAAKVDGRGQPLDLGRRRRTVSVPLMRALLLRDRQCRFPGCKHRGFLQAHHVEHWCDGGTTDIDNLLLLCHAHHVAVHEGGFGVEVKRDEEGWYPEFRTPEGVLIELVPERLTLEEEGLTVLRRRHAARSEPILRPVPLWDGTPLDLDAAVDALANKAPQDARSKDGRPHEPESPE